MRCDFNLTERTKLFMGFREKLASDYADRIPHYQDRKQHAAEDFLAGWEAAVASSDSLQQKIEFNETERNEQ